MEKKLIDYVYLYANSEMWVTRYTPRKFKVKEMIPEIEDDIKDYEGQYQDRYKLLLRPLSDACMQEKADAKALYRLDKWGNQTVESQAEITRYLLSKSFDLFNLIESGIALDKTKL